jgi:predicted ATPase
MVKSGTNLAEPALSEISVAGLKSIGDRQSIEIRPLTILAGANSSGKSTMMQGLLLLKQTLEASYDPGPLLLNGPNVRFSSVEQLCTRIAGKKANKRSFEFGLGRMVPARNEALLRLGFESGSKESSEPIGLKYQEEGTLERFQRLSLDLSSEAIRKTLVVDKKALDIVENFYGDASLSIVRDRCFLNLIVTKSNGSVSKLGDVREADLIYDVLHLPGLRGNPTRTYPLTAVGERFPGTFEHYSASVIAKWTRENDPRLEILGQQLRDIGLTWKVRAERVDDTQVELKVGRLPKSKRNSSNDLVSIADVGLGVSQTLPVLVSLLVAKPGQLVYIEQPEIHLHPRAQTALAPIIADAANRGVRAVIETHSSLLLLGIQSLVAEDKLDASKVKLHWFQRSDKTGMTSVRSADLDEVGRFGDWPEDFGDVSLEADVRYLNAVDIKRAQKGI